MTSLTRRVKISIYPSPDSVKQKPKQVETTVGELLDSLVERPEEVSNKLAASAWSPIFYSGEHRRANEALGACALVYDLDDPEGLDLEGLLEELNNRGWLYAIHETYTDGCRRLTLPLSKDCAPGSYAELREAVASSLSLVHDPACSDLGRLFFVPTQRVGGTHAEGIRGGSELLDPEEFVSYKEVTKSQANKPINVDTKYTHKEGFDLQKLLEEVDAHKSAQRRQQLLDLLNGTLRIPPHERNTTIHALMGSLSHMRNSPSEEVAEGLLRRVFSTRPGAETELENWVEEGIHSYRRGLARKAAIDKEAIVVESFFRADIAGDDWKSRLRLKHDSKGGVVGTKSSESNVLLILANDAEFKGRIKWNVLRNKIEVQGGFLSAQPPESLDVPLAAWLQMSAYLCDASTALAGTCLVHTALNNPFDPVKNMLLSLPDWDGVQRLDDTLLKYAQAEGNTDWIRIATRKFFISAVARVFEPGCQVDSTLVLRGEQGGGKTSFVRVLGKGFHVETSLDLSNKDTVMVASQNWIVELGELASLNKSDLESTRNFLTRKEDQIRLPYGKAVQAMPRRCVFIGTTNARQPLSDPDGSRRFWVISVRDVDTKGLEEVRDQLWSEALHYYKLGESWWLTKEESVLAASEAKVYEVEDPISTEILYWLNVTKNRPQTMSASEVAVKILQRPSGAISSYDVQAINRAMRKLQWEPTRKRVAGHQVRCFKVPPYEPESATDE